VNSCCPPTVVLLHKIGAILVLRYMYNVQLESAGTFVPEVNTYRIADYLFCMYAVSMHGCHVGMRLPAYQGLPVFNDTIGVLAYAGCDAGLCAHAVYACSVCMVAHDCWDGAQVCAYRCIVSYESALLQDFSLCILQKHNCLGKDVRPLCAPACGRLRLRNLDNTLDIRAATAWHQMAMFQTMQRHARDMTMPLGHRQISRVHVPMTLTCQMT